MSLWSKLRSLFVKRVPPPVIPPEPTQSNKPEHWITALARRYRDRSEQTTENPTLSPYRKPTPPPGTFPSKEARMAYDNAFEQTFSPMFDWANQGYHGTYAEGIGYFGPQYLSELMQRSEYRQPCEVIAEEMTRKWITIKSSGDEDLADDIAQLNDAMKHFKLRDIFRTALEMDGTFGHSFIYPDIMLGGAPVSELPEELRSKFLIDKSKIAKGSLRGFVAVDPSWSAPADYETLNPLSPEFYVPRLWYMNAKEIHHTRLFHIVSRPVPDILKPGYNFGGLSISQMIKPYVDNWLRTRQAVSDLVNSYTVWNLSTDMQAFIQGGGSAAEIDLRAQSFNFFRQNRGLQLTDKTSEDLKNISVPLSGLEALQSQAQEQMSGPTRIPLVKLFGITPTGLNPSAADEIRVFYDSIHGQQERVLTDHIKSALEMIQLHLWGKINPDIVFEFNPLWEVDEGGRANIQKVKADTGAVLMTGGVISPEEERQRIANDEESDYTGLEGPAPEPETLEENPDANSDDNAESFTAKAANGSTEGENDGV